MSEIILKISDVDPIELYGEKNSKLNILKNAFPDTKITSRGNNIKISGDSKDSQLVKSKIEMMVRLIKDKHDLTVQRVQDLVNGENPYDVHISTRNSKTTIVYGKGGKAIKPRTHNQKKLVDLVERNDIVFAVGPAGTGKTYTAVALAVRALKNRLVKKIILTRPAVEAGESLGFLPGDLKEKIDPYLRPLYDALDDMFPPDKLKQFMENRTIEIAPLAYMRGRTLDNSFVILDEAQNTTTMQIKMFLTRLGPNAKCIITGDLSQVDLPRSQKSGLRKAIDTLRDVKDIGTLFLTAEDVVRHRLVKEIIKAYEAADERNRFDQDKPENYRSEYNRSSEIQPQSPEETKPDTTIESE